MKPILMFFDGDEWHLVRKVEKAGLTSLKVSAYCDAIGEESFEQLPERVLDKVYVCEGCKKGWEEIG